MLHIHGNVNCWSSEEDGILRQYYHTEGSKVMNRLPGRTAGAIKSRVHELKLKTDNKKTGIPFNGFEDDIIRKYYPIEGAECYIRMHNRNKQSVKDRARKLGIKSRIRSVICIETKATYNSAKEASASVNGNVSKAINKGSTAAGYHWMYYEDYLKQEMENEVPALE